MLTSPVVSRLTERPRSNGGVSQTQDVNVRKRWDGLLKRLLMPITAVMSQENAAWNKDVVEEQVGQVPCLVKMLNSKSTLVDSSKSSVILPFIILPNLTALKSHSPNNLYHLLFACLKLNERDI
jgi:hypothetical protein